MSYILNALRKSEQERQAVAPDTVTSRILSPQPQHPRVAGKLIVALIISNLLILAYFIWVNQTGRALVKSDTAALTTPETAPVVAPPQAKVEAIGSVVASAEPVPAIAATKTPSIADMDDAKKAPVLSSVTKPDTLDLAPREAAPVAPPAAKTGGTDSVQAHEEQAPAVTKSPSIADIAAGKKAPAPKSPAKPLIEKKRGVAPIALPSPEDEPEILPAFEPPPEIASIKPAALPAKNDIPFLYELPTEFRRAVPKLNINVFVYAKEPKERFVMIDMEKYKTGQMIKDGLELNEIRPDSLVVRYHNQIFQIERP